MTESSPTDGGSPHGAQSEPNIVGENIPPSDGHFGRYLLITALLLAVAISTGGWIYYRHQSAEARGNAQASLAAIADLKAQDIANWMEERRGDAEVARMSVAIKETAAHPDDAEARTAALDRIEAFRKIYGYAAVILANASGEVQLQQPAGHPLPEAAVTEHIQLALRSRQVVVSDLEPAQPGKPAYLWLSCPVFGQAQTAGPPAAALLLVIDPKTFLYPTVQRWPTQSRTAETLLVQNGPAGIEYLNERLHEPKAGRNSARSDDSIRPTLQALATQSHEGIFEAADYRGVRVIAAVRKVTGTPWLILAKVDEAEILAPLHREAWNVGIITALLLLATTLGIGLLWRQEKFLFAQRALADRMGTEQHIRQLNRVYAVLSDINTLIVRERNPQKIFESACVIATEVGKFRMACIRLLNEITHRLEPAASAGAVEGLEDALSIDLKYDAHGAGPSGRAVLTGEHQVVNDIVHDPRMKPWRKVALRLGYRACASFPLRISGKVAGVFTLHAAEVDFFDSDELHLLDELAGDIGFALEVHEKELHRQSLEEQFRQSQKMEGIGQLAGGVAHDFNNILGAIIVHAELADMEEGIPPSARESLREIRLAAERAATLTRQLLMFSRRQVMQPRQLDLNEVVPGLAKMLQRIIGEDIRMQLSLHPTPLIAHADAGMIDQVLMNLAVNARDAMPGGGRLLIETAAQTIDENFGHLPPDATPGRYVRLSVSDTGSGIPPEVLPKIFEPFFTTKDAGKGTGLGLATVFGIVKQHRGWIHVESAAGRGTTFQVFIPAMASPKVEPAIDEPKPKPRGGTETILLVEDDMVVRTVMRAMLERHGYRIIEAASGMQALTLWPDHQHEVALLLTDLVMPGGLSGQDLARRLEEKHPNLSIIFISGYSADIAGRALELRDGENFVQKPCSSDHLLETVRRSLDAKNGK